MFGAPQQSGSGRSKLSPIGCVRSPCGKRTVRLLAGTNPIAPRLRLLLAGAMFFALGAGNMAWADDPDISGHQIRLVNAGFEIEFSGGMGQGSADELSRMLDANPAVRVIHLNSHGGLVSE